MHRDPFPSPRGALWPFVVVLAVIVLLPVGRASEVPIAIGIIAAIVLALRGRIDWRNDPAIHLVAILFACYWMPEVMSALSAVAPERTASTIASTLRFLPFAAFTVWALRDARLWSAVTPAVAAIVALWIVDAFVQIMTGHSLGGAAEAERISGIFGAGNLKLGPVLAVLSPFVLIAARDRFGWRGLSVAFVALAVPILLAGSRAAWLMYALVCLVIAWRETRSARAFAIALAVAAILVAGIGAMALHDSKGFGARIERSLLALRGTESAVDTASAGRLSIWHTALSMSRANPMTGVGVRGFRYAYPAYAAPNDTFVDTASDTGASHAHQIVLEVLSETGVVGLLFWLAGTVFAVLAWGRAGAEQRSRARPPALALFAMCFPLNTHFAFYSAWWGLLFWWLLALYCAALGARETDDA
ncbi:MAG TPA: O-antigen ligase family protein [Rhodanobacteraceae bacterium]|nr:O-antigen ligase family protein [Rhodanobacteraceae bacterium]